MRSLAILELVNVPLWVMAWFGLLDFPLTAANLAGFAAFAVLLLEGGAYWLLKIRQLRSRAPQLPGVRIFRMLRIANIALIVAALAVAVPAAVLSPGRGSFPGLGLALFGAVEHINYFQFQLVHEAKADLRRLFSAGLRRSHLARDLLSRPTRSQ